jgi:NAD(P)-dependent dehydrogenase (short-subunit alcohol dehydrogenase family)
MTYEVTTFAERYGQVCMKIAAPELSGEIKALLRPQPQRQPNYAACATEIGGLDFSDQRALVIGGSRGLGEITAKILCAGGADTILTYHSGLDDARKVAHEIASHGGQADCIGFDVLNPAIESLNSLNPGWLPTHLYYFATPFISPSAKGKFSQGLFDKFCNYYVSGFANTVNLFRPLGLRNVFYPSTIYLDEIPPNMAEYASAKAAGETLCAFYQKEFQEMTFFTSRLPRMATDQTAGLPTTQNADALPVLIQTLGRFQKITAD